MKQLKKGYLLVEILLAFGVFAIIIVAVVAVFSVSQETARIGHSKSKAILYQRDYLEKIKNIRRDNWDALVSDRYIIVDVGGNIVLQTTVNGETVNGYTRYLEIENAYRDVNGDLVETPDQNDPSTKKITVTVSWEGLRPGEISESMYITRYLDNLAWIQTTEADFDAGTHNATTTVVNDDGEVILGAGGYGDWCRPSEFIVAELDLPDTGDARKIDAYEGKAFTGTNTYSSGSFVEIDITNDDPPDPSITNIINGYETRDVFIDGDYAYIATSDISRDVVIVDLTTNTEVGYFDDPAFWGTTQGVFVVGDVGYAIIGPRIHSFDLSDKTGSRPQLDEERLGTGWFWFFVQGYRLHIVGNYAYVAVDIGWSEMRLINISDPNSMFRAGYADVNGQRGKEVFVNDSGSRAYLATSESGSRDEFFIINTDFPATDKDNPSFTFPVISSYNANGMDPRGVKVVPGNRAILVGLGGEEYQVIDTTNENNPARCGGIQVDAGIYGVEAVLEADGDAYSYVVTGDPTNEFKIIEGGPGGAYSASGYFESQTLDTSYSTAFNRFDITHNSPASTNVRYQVSSVDVGGSGTCDDADFSDFNFVGPDGSSGTFFSGDDAVPLDNNGSGYENPARCFRFRAYLSTGDYFLTPTFFDFTVNYSP